MQVTSTSKTGMVGSSDARDARGGTRYTEIIRSHFGVISPDARFQRPEYLGGGSTPINISPIGQTSATAGGASATPLGNLAAM